MASKAKKTYKKVPSYAEVTKTAVEKKTFFESAVCNLTLPPNVPHKRIPNTNEEFSFFIDLNSTNATEEEVAKAITINGILGVGPRSDLKVVEFICKDEETVEVALGMTFQVKGKKPFVAIIPRHKCNKYILVKLSNVPIAEEEWLKTKLEEHWSQYGRIIGIAPYKFPGKEWLTKRWDLVIQLKAREKKLAAQTVFTIGENKQSIVASWPGAAKTCLVCKLAGHSTSLCPQRNLKSKKVGASANPRQLISKGGQSQKKEEKGPKVSMGPSEKQKAPPSIAPAMLIPDPDGATFQAMLLAPKPCPAAATTSAMEGVYPFNPELLQGTHLEQGVPTGGNTTPPPFNVEDPETPKKGKKCMAKEADAWTPTSLEVNQYIHRRGICPACFKTGHMHTNCPTKGSFSKILYDKVLRHPHFQPYLKEWREKRRKEGIAWRAEELQCIDAEEMVVLIYCAHCKSREHNAWDCPNAPPDA